MIFHGLEVSVWQEWKRRKEEKGGFPKIFFFLLASLSKRKATRFHQSKPLFSRFYLLEPAGQSFGFTFFFVNYRWSFSHSRAKFDHNYNYKVSFFLSRIILFLLPPLPPSLLVLLLILLIFSRITNNYSRAYTSHWEYQTVNEDSRKWKVCVMAHYYT